MDFSSNWDIAITPNDSVQKSFQYSPIQNNKTKNTLCICMQNVIV